MSSPFDCGKLIMSSSSSSCSAPACKYLNAQAALIPRTGDDCVAVLVINVLRSAGLAVADPRLAVERAIWTVVKDSPRAQGAVIAIAALLGGPSLGIGVDFQMSFLYTAIGD